MPSEAVVVRAPEITPSTSASWNRKMYLATNMTKDERHGSGNGAPQEQADALRLQAVDEARAGGNAHDGDENVQPDRVHEPDRRRRNAAERRAHRTQPAKNQARKQRAPGGGQRDRYPAHLPDQRADQRADRDRSRR